MKQKRKVKSLLPQKSGGKTFLMLSLLILGLILCLGSLSLLTTSSVGAIGKDIKQVAYSGIDDKVEVLYHMDLADTEYLDKKVGEMYYEVSNGNFYIAGPSLVVNQENPSNEYKNEIGNNNYTNILGGAGNKINSDNITVIEGSQNKVAASNTNAVVLGGEGNEIIGNGGSDPAIMVGGSDNTIQGGHNGDVIIGGSNNTIGASVSNSFILGGNRNTVNANNVIVGGSNVTVDAGIDNIFAFSSNGSFSPNKSNMFYLNVARGLGVNVDSSKAGLSVNGPVSFGEVSISENCENESLGVIGTWYTNGYGCLVGCTQKSLSHGNKWELLDRGLKCQDYCETNSMRCYNEMEKLEEPDPYESYCSKGVDTSNASACTPVWNSYKNVIFETALVNSKKYGGVCPEGAADKCVYQCNDGYYLVKDETYSKSVKGGETKCFAECTYTWNDIGTVVYKHNDTVVGYNKNIVSCANDNPDNGNGTKNDPLPEHCGNNQHKKTLVCSNGKMYIVSSGKRASTTEAAPAGYLWHDCATAPYQCAGKYDISKTYINNTLLDTIPSVTKDRNQVNGTRGIYKLCLDYKTETPTANEKYPGNEKCYVDTDKTGNIPYEKHFQFLVCKNGYDQHTRSTDPDYMCRKRCTHNAQNTTVTKKDMEKVTLYRTPDENCSNPLNSANVGTACEAKTFTCNDGTWTPDDGYSNINNYRYISCTEHGNACSDSKVPESTMLAHTDHSEYYGPCFRWWAYDNSVDKKYTYGSPVVKWQCDYKDKWYRLDGCNPEECYHANSDKTFCEYDYAKNGSCSSPNNGGGSVGYKYKHYEGSSWNSKSLRYKDTCDIYCNRSSSEGGYYRAGNSCYKNSVCGGSGNPSSHYGNGTGWDYYWTGTTYISHGYKDYYMVTREYGTPGTTGYKIEDKYESNWCYYCDSFYHLENGTCVSDKHDCRGEIPEHAEARWNTKTYSYSSSAGWSQSDVGGGECRFDCEDGYIWNGYACEEVECNSCTWKIMYDAGIGTVNPMSQKAKCDNSLTILEATSDCYDFIGRTDGSTLYTKGQSITKSSNTIISLTAVWGDVKNIPACQGGCKGGDQPESPYANMERNNKVTGNTNVAWVYQSDKNAELLDCQWRCNEGYKRVGGTCVKQVCETGTPAIPSEGVKKGDSEYVGNSGKKWTRVADTTTSLSECQWKCDTDNNWEWNGTTCVKKVVAGCETIANGYCPTGNQSDSKADLKAGDTKSGEKWKCKGTTTSKDCFECVNGYKASGTSYSNYKCEEYTCGGTAPTGTTLLKGKSTYVNNPTPAHTSWTYLTGVSQSNLKVCEWSCPNEYEKSGNTCIKTKYGACTNPAVHGKCKEGTPTISESAAKNITGGWKWQCKGTSQGENADCIECDIANGYIESTDANGDKICVSTASTDGECDFVNAGCSAGEYVEQSGGGPYGKVWFCKGEGGVTHTCRLRWECGGTCELYDTGGWCANMYDRRSEYKKDECTAAGAYTTNQQYGGIANRNPCWTYIPSSTAGWVEGNLYSTNQYCSDAVASALYGGSWYSCFKWKGEIECYVGDNDKEDVYEGSQAVSKCNAISAKKPSGCSSSEPGGGTFVQTYTLTINANGGTYGGQTSYTYQAGVTLSVLTTQPTREGYKFKEWNSQSNGNGTTYNSTSTMPASNLTVYAVWEKVENKKYWLKTLANDYGGPCKGAPSPVDNTFMGLATPSRPYETYTKDNMGNVIGSSRLWPAEFSTLTSDGRVGTENDRGTYAWAQKQINEAYYGNNGSSVSFWRRYNPSNGTSEYCIPGDHDCVPCIVLEAI